MRGTSNSNVRGNTEDRRRRREWLVKTYRSNEDVIHIWDVKNGADPEGPPTWVTTTYLPSEGMIRLQESWGRVAKAYPSCRCYRCGRLLTVDTVSPDRIKPGCEGGTYRRDNIRPACANCQSLTGAMLGVERKAAKKK